MGLLDQSLRGPMEDETYADWVRRRWGPAAGAPPAAAPVEAAPAPAPAEAEPVAPPPPPPAQIPPPPQADDGMERFKAAQATDRKQREQIMRYATIRGLLGDAVDPHLLAMGRAGAADDVGQEIGMRQAIDMAPLKMRAMEAGASKAEADAALTGAKVPYAGQDAAADAAMKSSHAKLFGQQAAKGAADLEDTQAFRGALRNGDSTATALIRHLAQKYGGKDVSGAAGAELYPLLPTLEKGYAAEQSAKARMMMMGASLAGNALTPDAIDMAAEYYRRTGNLPALGRDAQARAKIIARAAELGQDRGSDIAANKADVHADQGSLSKQQQLFDMTKAWEATGKANLDVLRGISKQLVDAGSPMANRPLRYLYEKAAGDPTVAKFKAAHVAVTTEYAKILSGATSSVGVTDAARREAQEMLPLDATPAQIAAAADILETDAGNRISALSKQLGETKKRLSGKGAGSDATADPLGIR